MSERILFPEWRQENDATPYPFAPRSTLTAESGAVIPEGLFLDAAIYPIGGGARLCLSQAVVGYDQIVLFVGDENDQSLCSGTCPTVSPDAEVALYDRVGRPAGVLVSEPARLSIIQSWGIGTHVFGLDAAEFCATCCIPTPEVGLRGILLEDGELFVGDVWLVGSDGVVLRSETPSLSDENGNEYTGTIIRMDVVGDPLFRRRLCTPHDLFAAPNPIRKLRAIGPDGSEFLLEPDDHGGIRITGGNNKVEDTVLRVGTNPGGVEFTLAGSPRR
jgi:hypothetical protein